MMNFWEKFKFRIVPSSVLTILYLLIIGIGWMESGGKGEDSAILLIYLNLPFYVLFWLISGGGDLASSPLTEGVFIFLGGPLMYGFFGWLIGWAFEKCFVVPQRSNEKYQNRFVKEKKNK